MVLATDLANEGARASFDRAVEQTSGKTTHQIVGGPSGAPQQTYVQLRLAMGVSDAAPVIEGFAVTAAEGPRRVFRLLGVDLFAEAPFRSYFGAGFEGNIDIAALLTEPNTLALGDDSARELGVKLGDRVQLWIGGRRATLRIVGLVPTSGAVLEGSRVLLTDIATAQELLQMPGRVSRIDLILPRGPRGADLHHTLSAALPPGLRLVPSDARNRAVGGMADAFHLNLSAMSLLALVVGMFLIYNTMTFTVVRRRRLLGMLRALGVSRREVFR